MKQIAYINRAMFSLYGANRNDDVFFCESSVGLATEQRQERHKTNAFLYKEMFTLLAPSAANYITKFEMPNILGNIRRWQLFIILERSE